LAAASAVARRQPDEARRLSEQAWSVTSGHPTPENIAMVYPAPTRCGSGAAMTMPLVPVDVKDFDPDQAFDDDDYVTRLLDHIVRRDVGSSEQGIRRVLSLEPRLVRAAAGLVVRMVDGRRWPEAIDVARHLIRAAPDSGRGWALLGYAEARANHWTEAQA